MNRAYFVMNPRTYEDLLRAHLVEREQPYEIVQIVELEQIDYENFITDMRVSRKFLEESGVSCSDGAVKQCLLVRQTGRRDGILVVPRADVPDLVQYAAYLRPM